MNKNKGKQTFAFRKTHESTKRLKRDQRQLIHTTAGHWPKRRTYAHFGQLGYIRIISKESPRSNLCN